MLAALRRPGWTTWAWVLFMAALSAYAAYGELTRPKRIRLGERIVLERPPLRPRSISYDQITVIEPLQIRLLHGRIYLGDLRNREELDAALEKCLERGRFSEGQLEEPRTLHPRDVLLTTISFPIGLLVAFVLSLFFPAPSWIEGKLQQQLYGLFLLIVSWAVIFSALRFWDRRYRERTPGDESEVVGSGIVRTARWSLWAPVLFVLIALGFTVQGVITRKRAARLSEARVSAWKLSRQPCALGVENGVKAEPWLIGRWQPVNGGPTLSFGSEEDTYWLQLAERPGRRVAILGRIGATSILNVDARRSGDEGESWNWIQMRHAGDDLEIEGLAPPEKLAPGTLCGAVAANPIALRPNGVPLRYRRAVQ
jgi:hypothetical protein